jgi:hypothetical protein
VSQHQGPRGRVVHVVQPTTRRPAPMPPDLVERLSDILAAALVADLRQRAPLTVCTPAPHAPGRDS